MIGVDIDENKVRRLAAWRAPVKEPELDEYLELPETRQNLTVTNSFEDAVRRSEACLFVTPTPSLLDGSGSFDHTLLLAAIHSAAQQARDQKKRRYAFVVNSTVMPGFLAGKVAPMLRRYLNGLGFGLAYKPEFIALGTVIQDLLYPDLLLIGEDSEETGYKVERLYRELVLHDCQARRMPLVDAELAKISLNCAVTMKISFANQVGQVAKRLGADPRRVLGAVGLDRRVGHAALRPGLPFGGPCFPRDNRMFVHVAESVGEQPYLSRATDDTNNRLKWNILDEIPEEGSVGILGLAYKPGSAITDDALGWWLACVLWSRQRRVLTHDPMVKHSHQLAEVLGCKTVVICCQCQEYAEISVPEETLVIDPAGMAKVVRYKEEAVAQ